MLDQLVQLKPRVDMREREIGELKEKQAAQAKALQSIRETQAAQKATNHLLKILFVALVGPIVVTLAIAGIGAGN